MGNRAVIAFSGTGASEPCLYLHWNGGRASVEGFLDAYRALQIPTAKRGAAIQDMAAATQPFFGSGSVHVYPFRQADTDNGDHGLYWIDQDFRIAGREFTRRGEEIDAEKTAAIRAEVIALNALL